MVTGLIVAVQEERFRLVSPEGQGYLLNLTWRATGRIGQLKNWHRNQVPVRVQYEGEANLESGVAVTVEPTGESA